MAFHIKPLHGGGIQVENDAGHWVIFSLAELRSHTADLKSDAIQGEPALAPEKANVLAWAAFAAARGYAVEHGLIDDDRTALRR